MNSNLDASIDQPLPVWKRAMDLFLCVIALPVLAALMLMRYASKIVAPGPIFFRQERVGHQGRRFCLYKFRTMRVSAPTVVHQTHFLQLMNSATPMQKLDSSDDRLIRGGWFWRATGLDELPQIINVLRGEMSMVGPRPCIPYEYEKYSPAQCERLNSVPGLTGLWQVSGKNRTTFEEMVQLDVAYAQQRSVLLDLKIILLTPRAIWNQVADTKGMRRLIGQRARNARDISDVVPGLLGRAI
jgi:lipopolysaccharide/colanic/teichoic acid biosynthesis glycosyltransferase